MARAQRIDVGGILYHVINRANARMRIFDTNKDYQLFEVTLAETKELTETKKALLTTLFVITVIAYVKYSYLCI